MLRTPIWATASLLAVAISLAGCGEDKTPANQTAGPAKHYRKRASRKGADAR